MRNAHVLIEDEHLIGVRPTRQSLPPAQVGTRQSVPWLRHDPITESHLFWVFQSGGWTGYFLAMYVWGLGFMSPKDALVNKLSLIATGFILTLWFRPLFRKLRRQSWSAVASISFVLAVSFAGALAWRELHTFFLQSYYGIRETGSVSPHFVAVPLGTFLYDGFVLLAWSLLYLAITNWRELEQQRERAVRAEAGAQSARLRALRSQLEPHFLFNTLNAVSSLVVDGKNSEASRMITRLSEFLRLTLDTSDSTEIALAEELEFARRYLDIEQIRFGSRLQVTIDAGPETMSGMVPTLILQPLVENAVKHGVLLREEGGLISITASRNNGSLRLSVVDNGPGTTGDRSTVRGLGLNNTSARLHELYGDSAKITLGPATGHGTEVTLDIPFYTARNQEQDIESAV